PVAARARRVAVGIVASAAGMGMAGEPSAGAGFVGDAGGAVATFLAPGWFGVDTGASPTATPATTAAVPAPTDAAVWVPLRRMRAAALDAPPKVRASCASHANGKSSHAR